MMLQISNFALLSLLFLPSRAWWILSHNSLTQDRLDPIVTPGKVAYHVHHVIGSSGFAPTATNESLTNADCTTAPVQADMSSYWAPQLYYYDRPAGTFTLVPIQYVQTYYLQRPQSSEGKSKEVKAFPLGLRMLAGSLRTTYNSSNQEDRAVNFVCLDYEGGSGESDQLPTKQCPNGLRAQVVFPSCWDGVNLDTENHKSHMSYPLGSSPDSGDCPDSHPIKVVTMFHEWIFETYKFDFKSGVKDFVFATGDEKGLTFHADFISAWDVDVLQAAIDQCTDALYNGVENCPPFVPSIDKAKAESCKIPRRVEEDIDGPLTALPGCNPVPFTGPSPKCENLTTPAIKGYTDGDDGTEAPASESDDPTISISAGINLVECRSRIPAWTQRKMQKRHYPVQQHH